MKRVLQLVLSLAPGGTEHLVVEICRRMRADFDVTVCCLDDEGAWAGQLQTAGIEVIALRRAPGFRPAVGRQIAAIAKARQIELIHCHQYSPFVYGRLATCWNARVKLVYTEHGRLSDAPPPWKRRLVNPFLARFNGPIVAVSDELRQYMLRAQFPRKRVRVIHNGIAPGHVPSTAVRQRARQLLGVDNETFVIGTVARLDPVKDLQTLLDGFAIARRQVPRARLVIVGDGPERARLAERASQPDLDGSVQFAGLRSDVRDILPAADLYVNTSISEGVSITILEAMAAAVPIIATAAGGTPEVLGSGEGGILIPARDPVRLAGAMIALASDGRRRLTLAAAGRRRLEASFTIDRMVTEYTELYRCLLS